MSPASAVDIGSLLDHGRWTGYQKLLTLLAAIAILFDGFDIQILGVAIPSIMRDWHVPRSAFPLVLTIGMAGMAVASPLAGYLGDRFGRRTALTGCLALFGTATVATAFTGNITELAILRFLTGMGAGGALPNAGTLAAEFAPLRVRHIAVTLTVVCVPLGGMVAGVTAAQVLPALGWRALYLMGGVAPLLTALLLMIVLPESPRFLARHPRRAGELAAVLNRMGHVVPARAVFEDRADRQTGSAATFRLVLRPELLRDTLGLWLASLSSLSGIYLVFGWLPAMLTAQGLGVATASSALAAYNFGGVLGVLGWAPIVHAFGSKTTLIGTAIAGAVSALALEAVGASNGSLVVAGFALNGVLANAMQTYLYALATHVYPTKVRAFGVAAFAAAGRVGGMLSSFTGAAIIQAGEPAFLRILALCLISSAVGVALVRNHFRPREKA